MPRRFQSTHPRGVRRPSMLARASFPAFQSTHPRGVRRGVYIPRQRAWLGFNPRTRVGCDERTRVRPLLQVGFQSTHPRGVRLLFHVLTQLPFLVSIHAPAWGATADAYLVPRGLWVSIHAPAWGATPTDCDECRELAFQSTHPRGVRPSWFPHSFLVWYGFNPRTRVGCDIRALRRVSSPTLFQSTHPRGVRRPWIWQTGSAGPGFNPRTRVGCDRYGSPYCHPDGRVSIHAPAWGATGQWRCSRSPTTRFNPRTRVGCDKQRLMLARTLSLFQSTHPRGVRHSQITKE